MPPTTTTLKTFVHLILGLRDQEPRVLHPTNTMLPSLPFHWTQLFHEGSWVFLEKCWHIAAAATVPVTVCLLCT